TGRLPFVGMGSEMLTAKLTHEPPPPHQLVPGVPRDLDALASRLLRMSPEARPRLDTIRAMLGIATPAPTVGAEVAAPPFIGREEELEELARALDDVQRGERGRTVIVEGEPG